MTNDMAIPPESAFIALADPTRRQVFEGLIAAPLPVGKLAEGLPVSRSAVSQHLKVLSDAGLVSAQKQGRQNIYQVEPARLAALRGYFDALWGRALDGFAAHAEQRYREEVKDADGSNIG